MSAQYVRERYGVTFKRGDRVTVDGQPGTVTSRCHPTWRLEATTEGTAS